MICTKVQGDSIMVIEYRRRNTLELSAEEVLVDLEKLAEVQEILLTFEQLKNMKVQKKVWPNKLKRFDANEIVRRAKSRVGKKKYNVLTNNCEHFVVWCICGLKVSLQVTTRCFWGKESLKLLCSTIRECGILAGSLGLGYGLLLLKVLDNVSDKIFIKILSGPENAAFNVGIAIALVIKLSLCCYEIRKALDERKSEEILTDNDLDAKIVEIVTKAWFHWQLSFAGFFAGLPYGLIGSLVGVIVGIITGTYFGVIAKWYCWSGPLTVQANGIFK
ncbi:uncharacterized protein LOC116308362 [Actinia tenebrosa]|uniref:Uncharacterized protein LOC116308362 n=1 Tax=Actinia tenebrosa TaxID=6105 RepID=A0A6P8J4L7_ACTTE|nr:uncharacterized protein LOC116308362 [Actinia tenebrosa]